jgi:Arf-GAP/coiled-coil/ANK repeat/PH domain-containing protein
VSEEKEAALIKNAQVPRNKQHEVEEATNILTATRKCFRHIVLDYVLQVQIQDQLTLEILNLTFSVNILKLTSDQFLRDNFILL